MLECGKRKPRGGVKERRDSGGGERKGGEKKGNRCGTEYHEGNSLAKI